MGRGYAVIDGMDFTSDDPENVHLPTYACGPELHLCTHQSATHQCWCGHVGDHSAADFVPPKDEV